MNVLSVDLRLDQVELILLPPINRNLDWLGWIARRNAIYIGYRLMVGSRNAPPGLRVRTHIRTKSHGNLVAELRSVVDQGHVNRDNQLSNTSTVVFRVELSLQPNGDLLLLLRVDLSLIPTYSESAHGISG